jgi:hypothetical protein
VVGAVLNALKLSRLAIFLSRSEIAFNRAVTMAS